MESTICCAPGVAPPEAISNVIRKTDPTEPGIGIVALSSPPASPATADAIVSHDPATQGGMVARANELHRAGIVQQCMELFRIVAQLKKDVLARRVLPFGVTWKEYVAQNFTFSLATADNYARIGRGDPAVLTALGAVRHLHVSGRPGNKAAKKTISKEEMATATDADTVDTSPPHEPRIIEGDSALLTGAPSSPAKQQHSKPYQKVDPEKTWRWHDASSEMRALAKKLSEKGEHDRVYQVVLLMDLLGISETMMTRWAARARAGVRE